MTWTTQKPTTPGWYWWKRPAFKTRIIEVDKYLDVRLGIENHHVEDLPGEWAGPLDEPEEQP